MQDLKDEYQDIGPMQFLRKAWGNSTKNNAAVNYVSGAADAFRSMRVITLEEYNVVTDTILTSKEDIA